VNNNYSFTKEAYQRLENYISRWITPLLQQALDDMPVLVLTGARQVGKTTLLLNENPFSDFRFLSMDDYDVLRERVPSYASNCTTRMLKAPKAYWNDTGLAVFLAGYYQEEELRKARELGNFFESFIYHHLHVLSQIMTPPARLFNWRTQSGQEVDFVMEYGRKVLAIEVKQTSYPGYGDTRGLTAFLDDHPDTVGGLLLHGGTEIRWLGERIMAVPWTMVTGSF